MKKNIFKGCLSFFVIILALFLAIILIFDDSESTTHKKNTQGQGTAELVPYLKNFDKFVSKAKMLENQGKMTKAFKGVYKKKASFNGTIVEIGTNRVYLISNDKYREGMKWENISR